MDNKELHSKYEQKSSEKRKLEAQLREMQTRGGGGQPALDGFANAHFANHIKVGDIALYFGAAAQLRHVHQYRQHGL